MMKLYETDYMQLTDQDKEARRLIDEHAIKDMGDGLKHLKPMVFHKYPKPIRHYLMLFPNNYLDVRDLQEKERLSQQIDNFQILLDSNEITERKILDFIKSQQAYFLIASMLKHYFRFGHHEVYLFPEFQLGNSFQVDFLLVGKRSGGYEFVFIELESPTGNITLENGELGAVFRKGLVQIEDWKNWLEANYPSIKETYAKCKNLEANLPEEFFSLDTSRLHYSVIAGRRQNFQKRTYRIQRKKRREEVLLLHYDNLIDLSRELIGSSTY